MTTSRSINTTNQQTKIAKVKAENFTELKTENCSRKHNQTKSKTKSIQGSSNRIEYKKELAHRHARCNQNENQTRVQNHYKDNDLNHVEIEEEP